MTSYLFRIICILQRLVTKSNKKDTILWFNSKLHVLILYTRALSLYHHQSKIGTLNRRHEHRPKNRVMSGVSVPNK